MHNASSKKAISYLQDRNRTSFVFVLKPENSSLLETKRSAEELSRLGIATSFLIVNGILPAEICTDAFFRKKKGEEERILAAVKDQNEETKRSVEEDLNSPCAEEMAAFEKFMSYFEESSYDITVFDTAPTGHTLRLPELPTDWKGFIDLGTLTKQTSEATQNKYADVIEKMRNRDKSAFVFVMYPRIHAHHRDLAGGGRSEKAGGDRNGGGGRQLSPPAGRGK